MKKYTLILGFSLLVADYSSAQQVPSLAYPPNGGQTNNQFWSRAGNLGNGGNNQNNLFGTKWNSPIYTITGNHFNAMSYRMKVNGIFTSPFTQYQINGYGWNQGVNTTGYVLIGSNGNSISGGQALYNSKGAFSLLHLNGASASNQYQEYGYRPWMKTGITFTGNRDLSYMGLRKLSTNPSQEDITETTFLWSDNSQSSSGPDKLVFRFSGYGGSDGGSVSANRLSTTDLDALHVAQFTGTGLMGLGNTFGTNAPGMAAANYIDPKSLLHISYDWRAGAANLAYGFAQITYRRDGTNMIGTGETANDGLRFGIDNTAFSTGGSQYLNSYLRWQEASSFIIQTDWDNTPGGVQNGERMRITSIGALNNTEGNFGGNTSPVNRTRVAISADGANPVTQPRSLLHLGYNTSSNIFGGSNNDGWRNWMDVGMFMGYNSDNMYVGMKDEGNDHKDAVINWGDNQPDTTNGPDHLRFIFTSTTTALPPGQGNSVAQSTNGLETMRIVPFRDTIFNSGDTTYGRVGIGDFTASGVNQEPTHKLDVVGNGRFRYLPDSLYMADTTVTKYVMVDTNGVLRWTSAPASGLGALCGDTVSGNLKDNTHIDLNNFNYYFTNNDSLNVNHVGIGYDCGDTLPAKLSVEQRHPQTVNTSTIAISGINLDTANTAGTIYTGVEGKALGVQTAPKTINRGGFFTAQNAADVRGFQVDIPATVNNTQTAIGGEFKVYTKAHNNYGIISQSFGTGATTNTGIYATSMGSASMDIGGTFYAHANNSTARSIGIQATASFSSIQNVAGYFRVNSNSIASNIGIAASAGSILPNTLPSNATVAIYGNAAPIGTTNGFAGYFDGLVHVNGNIEANGFIPNISDQQFKTDTARISLAVADSLLNLLKPKSFYFDTTNNYGMHFSSKKQYGLIAQEVEQVIPNLVGEGYKPAMVDSAGNVVTQGVTYKTLAYTELIPLLIAGHQAQQTKIDSLLNANAPLNNQNDSLQTEIDSLITQNNAQQNQINDLNNRLTQLENCLGNLLPLLCQLNQSMVQSNPQDVQNQLRSMINVTLSNGDNIVLDQNVPNPFAEQTIIGYSIPASVQNAQINFYDQYGKLMKTVTITERGAGRLNVYGQDLSSGIYTYSLIADGKIVDTKRMVKAGY